MEVYINDMLVKSKKVSDHVQHLSEAFDVLRKYDMKLNPAKCTFRVIADKCLGYVMMQRGIEASHDQIKALINIQSPRNIKEVHKPTGCLATLNHFISRSSENATSFAMSLEREKALTNRKGMKTLYKHSRNT